jgi:hypothetical protein
MFFEPIYRSLGFKSPADVLDSDIKISLFYLPVSGFFRILRSTWGASETGRTLSIDVSGGGRCTHLDTSVAFANSNISPPLHEARGEPLIGLRGRIGLAQNIDFAARGDVGGFGAGSSFAWDAIAAFGYRLTWWGRPTAIFVGYKARAQTYKTGTGRTAGPSGWAMQKRRAACTFAFSPILHSRPAPMHAG